MESAEKIIKILEWEASWPWDMAAIFAFMKTLVPTSVVRESEYKAAAQTAWVWDRVESMQILDKVTDWLSLTVKQRKDFVKITKALVDIKLNRYLDWAEEYRRLAVDKWIDPNNVVFDSTIEKYQNMIIDSEEKNDTPEWPTQGDTSDFLWILTPKE